MSDDQTSLQKRLSLNKHNSFPQYTWPFYSLLIRICYSIFPGSRGPSGLLGRTDWSRSCRTNVIGLIGPWSWERYATVESSCDRQECDQFILTASGSSGQTAPDGPWSAACQLKEGHLWILSWVQMTRKESRLLVCPKLQPYHQFFPLVSQILFKIWSLYGTGRASAKIKMIIQKRSIDQLRSRLIRSVNHTLFWYMAVST
jgi:hypothetical protein